MGELLSRRRQETAKRTEDLRELLRAAGKLCGRRACVYATGSYGRGESSRHSDLDLFILGRGTRKKPRLSRLNEILVKADLIRATQRLRLPKFSGDGQYLVGHTVAELVGTLGKPEDDVKNTFTARLLLLLESCPLLGEPVYHEATDEVIRAYWGDFQDHKRNFMPAFLANDILRMWRTFCVNYEARTQREPEAERVKRKVKNYKLKHSRLLTCYSALFYLLAVFAKKKTVSPTDAAKMISLSPTQRLEWLLEQPELARAHAKVRQLIDLYEKFLAITDVPNEELLRLFGNRGKSKIYLQSAYCFGNLVAETLEIVGQKSLFYRLLVV